MFPRDDTDVLELTARVAPRIPEREDATHGTSYVDACDDFESVLHRHGSGMNDYRPRKRP